MKNPRTRSSGPAFRQARLEGRSEAAPAPGSSHRPAGGQQSVGMRPGGTPGQAAGGAAQQRAARGADQGYGAPKAVPAAKTGQGGQAKDMSYGAAGKAGYGRKGKAGAGTACPESKPGPSGVSGARGAPIT